MYQIVADEVEMKWFFDHVISTPQIGETYIVCLSARSKKLTQEERFACQVNRAEMMRTEIVRCRSFGWSFDTYKQAIYKYNCDERAMLSKNGVVYPSKCLVCYCYVNPSSEIKCLSETFAFQNEIQKELLEAYQRNSKAGIENNLAKLAKVYEKYKSCHATNISRRIWRDFDCDLFDSESKQIVLPILREKLAKIFGKGNFVIVETSGGFHCLVKVAAIKSNPNDFILDVLTTEITEGKASNLIKEINLTKPGSQFVPLPGTLQYGNLVKVINKEDF